MPTVKYAISDYVADGTTTDYLITWDYLDEDHIAVYVDGTSNADPTANHTFTKLNNTTLRITDGVGGAVVSGAEIEIRRETPITTRAITFADGSALLAEDLNKNSDYLLYSMQEALDIVDIAAERGAADAQLATEGYRNETEAFKNQTATYLATVQADATSADNHRIASATSETNAGTSETAASGSATASATSATNSATSASQAAASASAASTSEANAATSEANSATSATESETAKTAAEAAKDAALAALDSFDDRYLGAKASDPTLDNDGNTLVSGTLYYNTTNDVMKVYEGSSWVAAYASLSGALSPANNLSDLSSASTARTNLGLGTAATTASTDYATSSQGTLADSALQNITGESIENLSDVASMTPSEGQALVYGSGVWSAADMAGGIAYTRHTANVTMEANEGVIADTSGGAFTVTLPASPAVGDTVVITDGADWATTNLTVGRNGSTIEGDSSDMTMDIGGVAVQFTYDGTTWQIYMQLGANGGNAVVENSSPTFGTVTATSYVGGGSAITSLTSANLTGALPAIDGSALTGIAAGATGGGNDEIFYENGQNVTTNYTITNGKNAMSAGPITIDSGVTVTVGAGETWTVV